MVARRAIVRWSWRLFRRQWRSQVLIVVLLVLAVSASVVGGGAAYNLAPAAGNAEFGSATHSLFFEYPSRVAWRSTSLPQQKSLVKSM